MQACACTAKEQAFSIAGFPICSFPAFRFSRRCDPPYYHQMERSDVVKNVPLGTRVALGLKMIFNSDFARLVAEALDAREAKPVALPPERVHASGLSLLSALQREGRLLDFLQQDVSSFSDEQIGAAARVVHSGSRKILQQYFDFEPASKQEEGSEVTVPKDFDAQQWRLTGNVSGQPPFRGVLRHHGWIARQVRMPAISETLDPRIVAPAEVELA